MKENLYKRLPPLERRPDGSLYRMTPAQRKQANSLIRRECCCCEDGNCIVLDDAIAVLITAALPADQGVCLFPLCRCHAVKGTVLLALYGRQSFIWVLSHVFPPFCFPLPLSPKRLPAPFLRRVPALARSPQLRDTLSRSDLWTKCPEVGSLRCFPCRGIPFRTVIWFSRCSPSMDYPKSTPK